MVQGRRGCKHCGHQREALVKVRTEMCLIAIWNLRLGKSCSGGGSTMLSLLCHGSVDG